MVEGHEREHGEHRTNTNTPDETKQNGAVMTGGQEDRVEQDNV